MMYLFFNFRLDAFFKAPFMARIPDDELDALKRSTDLAALVRLRASSCKRMEAKTFFCCRPSLIKGNELRITVTRQQKPVAKCMSSGQGGNETRLRHAWR